MLNRLQWLNALENVYYAANERSVAIVRESTWAKHRRPTEYIVVKEAVTEDDENDRLIHAYKPGLNIKLGLSFSSVRKKQRNVSEDRRGKVRPGGTRIHRAERSANSPWFRSMKANVPSHQLRPFSCCVIVQTGEGFWRWYLQWRRTAAGRADRIGPDEAQRGGQPAGVTELDE